MKKKSRKMITITGVAVLLTSGVAVGASYYYSNGLNGETNVSKTGKLSTTGQEEVVNKLKELNTSGYRPTEIEKELRKKY